MYFNTIFNIHNLTVFCVWSFTADFVPIQMGQQSNKCGVVIKLVQCTSYPSLCDNLPPNLAPHNNKHLPSCSSVGQKFGCVLAGHLWLKVSHEMTVMEGLRPPLKAPLRHNLLPSSLTWLSAGLTPSPHRPRQRTAKHMAAGFPQDA